MFLLTSILIVFALRFTEAVDVAKSVASDGVSLADIHSSPTRWPHTFPSVWTIGAVLSSPERAQMFAAAVERENNAPAGSRRLPPDVQLNSTHIIMDANPIRAAKTVCDVLIPNKPYVVIASRPSIPSDLPPMAVSFTCGFYKIPVIGISARESTFSDKVTLLAV
jgi:hypothetical protein